MSVQQQLFQVKVYDYLMTADNKPIVGKQVTLQASVDAIAIPQSGGAAGVMIPQSNVFSTKTDGFGYWSILVAPTDKFSVTGVVYTVMDGIHEEYQINPTFAGVPGAGWQSSAIMTTAPAVLNPAGQSVGPLTVTSLTDSGLTAGQVVFAGAAGLLSGDAGLFWDNVNKRLGIGTAGPIQALDIAGNLRVSGVVYFPSAGATVLVGGPGGVQFYNNAAGAINLNWTDVGNATIRGALTLGAGTGNLLAGFWDARAAASPAVLGGTVDWGVVNNANALYNLRVTDAGVVTIRAGLTINSGPINMTGVAGQAAIYGGTTGFTVLDNTGGNANLSMSDAGLFVVSRNSLAVAGDFGSGLAGQLRLTNAVGIGNGANTNMQAPLKATGGGPTNAVLVTDWIKIYDGATTKWIPAFT
jgi:hypothetical protein